MKKYQFFLFVFLSENFQFFGLKFSIYLNRHVFVMWQSDNERISAMKHYTVMS